MPAQHSSTSPSAALLRRCAGALAALAVVALLAAPPAGAQTKPVLDLNSLYQADLRALAMGNAFGPVARGEGALLYNPAGLVQYENDVKLEASLLLEGERGSFFSDTIDQMTGSPTVDEVRSYLDTYNGTSQNYRGQTFYNGVANLGALNFGLGAGVMDQERYRFTFNDNGAPGYTFPDGGTDNLTVFKQRLDMSFVSLGFGLLNRKLLVGATYKDFTYAAKSATQPYDTINDIDLTLTGPTYSGTTYDIGFIYRVEWLSALRPQWSIVANNVGGETLEPDNPAFDTLEIPATYNVGFAVTPSLPWSPVKMIVSAELEDASSQITLLDGSGNPQERSLGQRLRYGAEVGFWPLSTGTHVLSVRAGSYRGHLSRGVELNLWHGAKFTYTRYTEDLGHEKQSDLHEVEAVQAAIGIGF